MINNLVNEAEVVKIPDDGQIMEYPILSTPGLVVNEKVVCSKLVPTEGEITTWIIADLA